MPMKRILLGTVIALMLAPAANGVDEHHPDKASPPAKATPSAKSQPPALKAPIDEKAMAQMQGHMKKMQDIMTRLQKTTDPAERKKLMEEHTKEMQEGMQMMRGMGGGMMQGMMGGGMNSGGMMGQAPKDGAAKSGPRGRGAPMSQMMEHQKAEQPAPK